MPQTLVLDNVEPAVAAGIRGGVAALRKAGARIVDIPLRELAELPRINAKGGLSAAEVLGHPSRLIAKS